MTDDSFYIEIDPTWKLIYPETVYIYPEFKAIVLFSDSLGNYPPIIYR